MNCPVDLGSETRHNTTRRGYISFCSYGSPPLEAKYLLFFWLMDTLCESPLDTRNSVAKTELKVHGQNKTRVADKEEQKLNPRRDCNYVLCKNEHILLSM